MLISDTKFVRENFVLKLHCLFLFYRYCTYKSDPLWHDISPVQQQLMNRLSENIFSFRMFLCSTALCSEVKGWGDAISKVFPCPLLAYRAGLLLLKHSRQPA
jgi:hypothetical protein